MVAKRTRRIVVPVGIDLEVVARQKDYLSISSDMELAALAGLSQSRLSIMLRADEKQLERMTVGKLLTLSTALGVSVDELIRGEERDVEIQAVPKSLKNKKMKQK